MADPFGSTLPSLAGVEPDRRMDIIKPPVPEDKMAQFYQALQEARARSGGNPPEWLVDNLITRYFGESMLQAYHGGKTVLSPGKTVDERMKGASEAFRGTAKFAAPFALPVAAAEAPIGLMLGMAGGGAAQEGVEKLGEKLKLPPGARALLGDIAGAAFGGETAGLGHGAVGGEEWAALKDLWEKTPYGRQGPGSERGSLTLGGGKPKPGTLKREQPSEPVRAEAARPAVAGGPGGELPPASETAEPAALPGPAVTPKRPAGNPELQRVINDYNARRGLPPVDHSQYHPIDEKFSARVADAYDALQEDNSADPRVRAAYQALAKETKDQYQHLIQNGYQLEPWRGEGQPYANSHEMAADLRDHKHLYFFTGGEPHPFMDARDPDTGLTGTEMFRAVHDAWAHATGGFGFGPRGEEMAHDMHSQSFSPLARQAMSTETRGQNSWVNFGRQNYDAEGNPLNIPVPERPYAKQKVDLLPEDLQIRAGERFQAKAAPDSMPEETPKERDVKARTIEALDRRIPQEVRAVSKDPTKTVTGQPFHSLPLDQPGEGFLPFRKLGAAQADQLVQRALDEAVQESEVAGGSAARKAVEKTGLRAPNASWWHKAFSLPLRNRYWYELSGESFTGKHIDVPKEFQPVVIDTIAGTSGGVKPLPNAMRAVGVLAEDLQNLPVDTDLRDPVSVRNALQRVGRALKTLKYRSFSGTMQFTSGLSKERPLTTNDVQVADIFGIKGEDIGKNPILYEVLSRFFLKMRDLQNGHLGQGAQPWETWQMQAPAWVYNRLLKDPRSLPDDYSQVLPRIIARLAAAGVPTPGGKITMETLMDPRTPNLMSGTREQFLGTPIATMETATKLTPRGLEAYETYKQLEKFDRSLPWVRKARQQYQQIQRNMMQALMARKGGNKELGIPAEPSLLSQLTSIIVNRPVDVSRLDRFGYGVYQGEINPNMRIPMAGRAGKEYIQLDEVQREGMLAMLGEDTNQDAMAATLFQTVGVGEGHTFSVFLKRGEVNEDAIRAFSDQIGFPVNVKQAPNGVLIDINVEKINGKFGKLPVFEDVQNAAQRTFGRDPNVEHIGYLDRSFDNNYVTKEQYKEKINAWKRTQPTRKVVEPAEPGGGRGAGDTGQRAGDLARVRQKIRTHAKVRDRKSADWDAKTRVRLQKHLDQQAKRATAGGP